MQAPTLLVSCTYTRFSSNCELFISFYIRQSHKLQTNEVVRVYLIADENEMCSRLEAKAELNEQQMHLKRATFEVYLTRCFFSFELLAFAHSHA